MINVRSIGPTEVTVAMQLEEDRGLRDLHI